MGYAKRYLGFEKLPEVVELIEAFKKRKYSLHHCYEGGLKMQKGFTEVHLLPETDRLRLTIHDDGMGEKETESALKIGAEIVLKHGYVKGTNKLDSFGKGGLEESDDEYYKYLANEGDKYEK